MTGRRDGEGEGARGQPTSSRASFAPAPLATEPLRLGPPRRAAASLPLVPGCAHPCLALRLASSPGCADPRAPTMLYASAPTQHFASVGVLRVSILLGGLEGAFAVAEGSEGFLSIVPLPRLAPAARGGCHHPGEQRWAGGAERLVQTLGVEVGACSSWSSSGDQSSPAGQDQQPGRGGWWWGVQSAGGLLPSLGPAKAQGRPLRLPGASPGCRSSAYPGAGLCSQGSGCCQAATTCSQDQSIFTWEAARAARRPSSRSRAGASQPRGILLPQREQREGREQLAPGPCGLSLGDPGSFPDAPGPLGPDRHQAAN